jgi:hypothetical protein
MSWVIAVVNIGSGPVNKGYRLVCLDFVSSGVLSVAGKNMRAMCFGVDHGNSVFPGRVRPRPCARSPILVPVLCDHCLHATTRPLSDAHDDGTIFHTDASICVPEDAQLADAQELLPPLPQLTSPPNIRAPRYSAITPVSVVVIAPSPLPLLRLRLPRYYKYSNRMSWSCNEVQTSLRFRVQRGCCSRNILLA